MGGGERRDVGGEGEGEREREREERAREGGGGVGESARGEERREVRRGEWVSHV